MAKVSCGSGPIQSATKVKEDGSRLYKHKAEKLPKAHKPKEERQESKRVKVDQDIQRGIRKLESRYLWTRGRRLTRQG